MQHVNKYSNPMKTLFVIRRMYKAMKFVIGTTFDKLFVWHM